MKVGKVKLETNPIADGSGLGRSGRLQTITLTLMLIGGIRHAPGFALPSAFKLMWRSGILSGALLRRTLTLLSQMRMRMRMGQTSAKLPRPRMISSEFCFGLLYAFADGSLIGTSERSSLGLLYPPQCSNPLFILTLARFQ